MRRPLWHNPEFLREAMAEHDFLNSAYTLVGYAGPGDDDDFLQNCDELDQIYGTMNVHPLYCATTESELAKLVTNAYLATQISFWNGINWIANGLGVNSHQVARLVALDSRVSPYGAFMHGKPYGGRCLPKDLAQLIRVGRDLPSPVPVPLLEGVRVVNVSLGGE
jgi:UDPglucose 6-dehydrogenase